MTDNSESSDRQNGQLDEVIAQYVRAAEEGKPLDRDELLSRHADLATDLRDFFRHRDRMQALLDPLRSAADRILNIRCPHCRNSIELLDDQTVASINCPSCGSDFSLVGVTSTGRPQGVKRIGQFQLVEQVGAGQFGTVWKARDLSLERTVAIKIPRHRQLNETETEVFLRDARVSAQLKHPNIVSVHEVGKHDDTIHIVSDFIAGASLKEWVSAKPLNPREATSLCIKIAKALHYAHESGVVHRDVKPSNIMMDLQGEPHIVDFGLAKRDAGEITMTLDGQILGTPAYMSPEQARGDSHYVDRKADVYSLGVILFELLTGELPFRGDKQMLLVQILKDEPPSPRGLNVHVPRDLETICLKCLEKNPQGRYDSALSFADDCRRFLDGVPVRASPVSRISRGWRWCHRNPVVACMTAAIAALLVGIAVVSSVGFATIQTALGVAQERTETIEQNLYYSEMNRASNAAKDPDGLGQIRALLERWRPRDERIDRRGWEWFYLESLLHEDLVTLREDGGAVFSLAWDPAGSRLAAATGFDTNIWRGDGRTIYTLHGHEGQVYSVDWNLDGTLLATGSLDGTVKIWDTERGESIRTLQHTGSVYAAVWSHDDQWLVTLHVHEVGNGSVASRGTVWSSATWERKREFGPTPYRLDSLRWMPDGDRLVAASSLIAFRARIWDVTTGKEAFLEDASSVSWSQSGRWRLTTGDFSGFRIWDQGEQVMTLASKRTRNTIAWSPTASQLAYVAGHKVVKVKDMLPEAEAIMLRGHLDRVSAVCWHPGGERLATGSIDGAVKVWDVANQSSLSRGSRTVSWSPDGSRYASRIETSVLICEPHARRALKRLDGHGEEVFAVAWSPDGLSVASADFAGEVRLWDVATGDVRWTVKSCVPDLTFNSPMPAALTWSPDSRRLAFPQAGHSIGIVDANSGKKVLGLEGHTMMIRSLAWSPGGARVASCGYDGLLRVWNAVDGKLDLTRTNHCGKNVVCWSPDGTRLATAADDNEIQVWSIQTEAPLLLLRGHTTYVYSVSWSPDGQRIASSDESGRVRVWDANTGQQTISLSYPSAVPMVSWAPDGKRLAAVAFGGGVTVRIWDAAVEPAAGDYW